METDIDRLHDLIINDRCHRRCGRTFLLCHTLAGEVEVGDTEKIICLGNDMKTLDFIRNMLYKVFDEHKLSITEKRKDRICVNGKTIFFFTHEQWNKRAKYEFGHCALYEDNYHEKNDFLKARRNEWHSKFTVGHLKSYGWNVRS